MSDLCFSHITDDRTGARMVAVYERGKMHRPLLLLQTVDFRVAMRHLRPSGDGLAAIRKEYGYRQSELAEMADVSRTCLSQIENGEATNLTLRTALRISEVLDASVSALFPSYFPAD